MPSWPAEANGARFADLVGAGYNVARLPATAVTRELSTDAGHRHPPSGSEVREKAGVEALLGSLLGVDRLLLTDSGRDAEAIVASALVAPGRRVLANEAYVSGRWWIERFGGTVDEFGSGPLPVPSGNGPEREPGDLAYLVMTLPPAQLGPGAGRPVSPAEVRSARIWIDRWRPELPLVLDASRLWENAAATGSDPADFLALADVVILSAGKDIGAARGGVVAARDDTLWQHLVDAAMVWHPSNVVLGPDSLAAIANGCLAVRAGAAHERWRELRALGEDLVAMGLPRTWVGCGSVYLDASAWLPGVARHELPAQTLLDVIFLLTGWRGLGTAADETGADDTAPTGHDGSLPTVRLAVRDAAAELRHSLPLVAEIAAELRSGLRPLPPDRAAPYLRPAEPVDPSAWPSPGAAAPARAAVAASAEPGPRWRVARPNGRFAPQRALAEAITRSRSGSTLQTSDRVLRALHQRFGRSATEPGLGEPLPVHAVAVADFAPDDLRPGAVVAVEIESSDRWPAVAGLGYADVVDVFWAAAPENGASGGLVAVRVGSPLDAALDAGSLFTMSTWFGAPVKR